MRALVVAFFVAFVAAVLLPNDVGTDELPATGSKCFKAAQHPVKGKAALRSVLVQQQIDRWPGDALLIVYRGVQIFANVQRSPALQI